MSVINTSGIWVAQIWPTTSPDRVSLHTYKEIFLYAQRVRNTSSRTKSFVCQTTPHFGSTSRKVSYSVRSYITTLEDKCKSPILSGAPVFMKIKYICYIFKLKNS